MNHEPGTGDTEENETGKDPCPHGTWILVGGELSFCGCFYSEENVLLWIFVLGGEMPLCGYLDLDKECPSVDIPSWRRTSLLCQASVCSS